MIPEPLHAPDCCWVRWRRDSAQTRSIFVNAESILLPSVAPFLVLEGVEAAVDDGENRQAHSEQLQPGLASIAFNPILLGINGESFVSHFNYLTLSRQL